MSALKEYEVSWDEADMPITLAIKNLEAGIYPDSLVVFHQDHGMIRLDKPGLYGSTYTISRSGPPLPGFGISRSFGPRGINEEHLLEYIFAIFSNLQRDLGLNIARQKLQRLQLEGAKKMTNKFEKNTGKTVPKETRNRIAQMLGEKKPVAGSNSVLSNFARIQDYIFVNDPMNNFRRINTSLFQGGNKRKTIRRRKGRKATRKH
jgi:hypothetical protein